ncbi:MAG: flagellar hook-basal body complex protein FliE [Rhodomicrobium sp.]
MTVSALSSLADISLVGSSLPIKTAAASAQTAGAPDFASVMADMANQTVSSLKTSEDMAIKGIQGQAPVQDVVQAVMTAQTSLQTAMAIRDKAISAYQDLTRMTI